MDEAKQALQSEILDYVAHSKEAHFMSQQRGDPELSTEAKREVAEKVLERGSALFLARFGRFLAERHLQYFEQTRDYEVDFHLQQLRRFLCKEKRQVDVRNRRYEALKRLMAEGTYFSEAEMRQRNPLLYQQLVGRFLTEEEIEERNRRDIGEMSLVNVVMAQVQRSELQRREERQREEEEGMVEELDTSDEEEEEVVTRQHKHLEDDELITEVGEYEQEEGAMGSSEKELLKGEFTSLMYCSFLDGQDVGFDYSEVDGDPDLENIMVRTQDEEERYFDSESPQVVDEDMNQQGSNSEDELDVFMEQLKEDTTPAELATQLEDTLGR